MNINGVRPPPHFFEFKLAHLLTIILLCGFGVSWWIKHEDISSRADAAQTITIESHERRMLLLEQAQREVVPDVREIKTKLNIMAELLDGEHKKPELHR